MTTETTDRWWYTFVKFGRDPMPARGPWASRKAADEAMERFRAKYGALADTYIAAGNVRLVCRRTRAAAREADIGNDQ